MSFGRRVAIISEKAVSQSASSPVVTGFRPLWFAAPLAAMAYPLPLAAFHAAVGRIEGGGGPAAWAGAGVSLPLAFLVPVIALLAAMRLAAIVSPSQAEVRARRVALLAVAAPPLFTATGVVLYMLGNPLSDAWCLALLWALSIGAIIRGERLAPAAAPVRAAMPRLRVAHGFVAVLILTGFLGFHIANHFAGLAGPDAHRAVMKALRHIYRAPVIEPILLAGFLFLVVSGGRIAWRLSESPGDRFRTFQLASGVYLLFFLLSHVNAVLVLARSYLGIDSDWGFATGAPAGLIRDAWNIRLVPLYTLSVFFALAHPFAGARVVMLAHGGRKWLADGVAVWGSAASALAALAIILGMCGLRVHFE